MDKYLSPYAYQVWQAQWEIFVKVALPCLGVYLLAFGLYIYHRFKQQSKLSQERRSQAFIDSITKGDN
jgi:hypothetical protein